MAAFGLAGLAVWVYPIVCGLAGMAFGAGATAQGDRLGRWGVVAAGAGLVVGALLSLMPPSFFN